MLKRDINKSYFFYICRLILINNNIINYCDILEQDAFNY
jgi:hypothetical protein